MPIENPTEFLLRIDALKEVYDQHPIFLTEGKQVGVFRAVTCMHGIYLGIN